MLIRLFFIMVVCFMTSASYFFDYGYTDDKDKPPEGKIITDGWVDLDRTKLNEEEKKKQDIINSALLDLQGVTCGEKRRNPIRIGIIREYPPFYWEEVIILYPDDFLKKKIIKNYKGMNIALLLEALAEIRRTNLEFHAFDNFKDMERALQRGEIDIVPGLHFNNDPMISIEYILPAFLTNYIVAVSPDHNIQDKSVQNIINMKGISRASEGLDSFITYVRNNFGRININLTNSSYKDIYLSLFAREYDYLLTSIYTARTINMAMNLDNYVYFSKVLWQQQFFMAFSKNTDCRKLSGYIKKYIENKGETHIQDLFFRYQALWSKERATPVILQEDGTLKEAPVTPAIPAS